jgi:hypothetical protein
MTGSSQRVRGRPDSTLEQAGFEPLVPLARMRSTGASLKSGGRNSFAHQAGSWETMAPLTSPLRARPDAKARGQALPRRAFLSPDLARVAAQRRGASSARAPGGFRRGDIASARVPCRRACRRAGLGSRARRFRVSRNAERLLFAPALVWSVTRVRCLMAAAGSIRGGGAAPFITVASTTSTEESGLFGMSTDASKASRRKNWQP